MIDYISKTFRVRYTETDQMGFAHHSHYLNYFEMARIEWFNSIGFSYAGLERQGIVMPVVSANINYKSPAYFDELLRIKLSIIQFPKATIEINYTIINESDREIAYGSTTLAFLNNETKRPIRCPQILLEIIESL